MVRSLLLTYLLLFGSLALTAQTVLSGTIRDEKEELIGATVKVMKGAEFVRGGITDATGNYRILLDPGNYDVEVSYTGYASTKMTGVRVLSNTLNVQDFTLSSNAVLTEVVITQYKVPLIKQDETSTGQALTSEQIKNLPTRSVSQIVATTAGATSIDGGDVNIKGSRANGTNYYIDGIRVSGSPPPVQDLEQLQVITGGLGAEYGDVTGGVISVVTKGPASNYHGAIEVENSHGLDAFGWLLAQANISGPIVKKKLANGASRTVVGFRLSGQYNSQKDDDPSAVPIYSVKESVRNNLIAHPLKLENGTLISSAEQLTNDSMDVLKYRPNEDRKDIDVTSKLDFRLTDQIDFSVTGTFKDTRNKSTPEENQSRPMWRAINSFNNPTDYDRRYRAIARFRHRLGNPDAQKSSSNKVAISNASYQLQFGFERALEERYSPLHKDRLFDYGYMGRFDFAYVPITDTVNNQIQHIDYREVFRGFKAGYEKDGQTIVPNQGLVNYNEFANPEFFPSYVAQNGRFLNNYDDIWSDMHSNINKWYDRNSKKESDIITIMANTSFDLKLGKTGVHNIQVGIMNEQRTNRSWTLNPFGLWNLMQLNANNHFNGLDTTNEVGQITTPLGNIPQYGLLTLEFADNKFYREARKAFNVPIDQYLNVNTYSPDQFSLSMFSPRELTERGLVGYYGYDHTGQRGGDNVSFEDFFTSRDAEGIRNFPIAPLRPLYQAAYVKDKFTFNKMIISLGLRVERFDLNTKVLRDEYSLYKVMDAKKFYDDNKQYARPSGIGDDFKVYVNSRNDPSPRAFRDANNVWYFDDGRQANDGSSIFGGQPVVPALLDTILGDDIFDPNFNSALSFEDYTPQVNWLPRLAFSFPISSEANFFAHYDVLVQRPSDNWEVSPLTYLYFYNPSAKNNANMRPERVVDYEVGFQQKLNNVSAIKFSAYYRELRDMIQRRTITNVPVIGRYDTYGNIDFGTVKGFTVQYDLRRVRNAELRLAYTLQFADGTGSDANSQRGLTSRGNLRTLYPLNFDERHNINAVFDYRFASGKGYNGPRIGGKDILANFGANFQMFAVSGRPYTARVRPTRFGGEVSQGLLNGNRLPWRFNIDMRVDKSFNLAAQGKRPLNFNLYLRVSNLLNRKNVVKVYPVTGSPSDDGFLAGGEGVQVLRELTNGLRNVQAFRDAYSWMLLDPDNYTQPRRIYIGGLFEF